MCSSRPRTTTPRHANCGRTRIAPPFRTERAKEGGGMFSVELYGRVRHACQVEGLSQREAARRFGLHRKTVRKMLAFSVPPGYRRSKPPARPKLDPFTPIINRILEA